jgi:hypothetical protein
MATNFYLDHYQNKSEQNLIEDLTIESIKFHGMDVIYIPRETFERDNIFGEDIRTKFGSNYMIEMYFESVDGFEGDGDFLSAFGMQIKDTASVVVSKRRFQEVVYGKTRPMEGDLIYLPLSNGLFEINYVEHENPFYQLGKLYTYKLTIELFTHSNEEFDTGQPNIDSIMIDHGLGKEIDPADNKDIQIEADEIVIESGNPKEEFLNFNELDPFDGL